MGFFSICYDMNVPEEHPLMIRSLFTSSTLTTAFAGTCAIRLYEFGIPFYDIGRISTNCNHTKLYYTKIDVMNVKNLGLMKALNTRYNAYFIGDIKPNRDWIISGNVNINSYYKILYNHIYQNLYDTASIV